MSQALYGHSGDGFCVCSCSWTETGKLFWTVLKFGPPPQMWVGGKEGSPMQDFTHRRL